MHRSASVELKFCLFPNSVSPVRSLRRSAIPVVNAYNETVPELFLLPADQQTAYVGSRGTYTLTLASPTPGRVYLTASVLNTLQDVVDFVSRCLWSFVWVGSDVADLVVICLGWV